MRKAVVAWWFHFTPYKQRSLVLVLHFSRLGAVAQSDVRPPRIDPHVQHYTFMEIGHEIISMAILSLPLIQEGQLSVTDERIYS